MKEVGYNWSTSGSTVALSSDKVLPKTESVDVLNDNPSISVDTTYSAGDTDPHEDQNGGYVFSGWDKTGEIKLTPESDFRTVVSGIWEWKNFYRYSYNWNASDYSDLNATLPIGDYVPTGSLVNVDTSYNSNSVAEMSLGTWKTSSMPIRTDTTNWRSVCYSEDLDRCVAVGGGSIAGYTEGSSWKSTNLTGDAEWTSVCYGNGIFVAISNNSSLSNWSDDGITWNDSDIQYADNWYSICYARYYFVAISLAGSYALSADGMTWSYVTGDAGLGDMSWSSICYGNGKVIAVSTEDSTYAYSNVGGNMLNWETAQFPLDDNPPFVAICYGNGRFVAISSNIAVYSENGTEWATADLPSDGTGAWTSICYGNNKFVITSLNGEFAVSNDGSTWAMTSVIVNFQFNAICSTESEIIAVGNNGDYYYGNGESGNVTTMIQESYNWYNLSYHDGMFITVAYASNVFAYSTDGINWTQGTVPTVSEYHSCAYFNNKFILMNSTTIYSIDKSSLSTGNWNVTKLVSTQNTGEHLCYGNGRLVVIVADEFDGSSFAYYTNDGINWNKSNSIDINRLGQIVYGNNKYIAMQIYNGGTDSYAISTDAITWEIKKFPKKYDTRYSFYANGMYLALIQDTNQYIYSTDGINWTEGTLPSGSTNWKSICYGSGKYVVIAYNSNMLAYSTDGIIWKKYTMPSTRKYNNIAYGNGKFVIIIYKSDMDYYLTPNNQYYSFSGWNKSNFNITSNTTISGTWSKKNMLSVAYSWSGAPSDLVAAVPETEYFMPNTSVCVDTNYNNKMYKKESHIWIEGPDVDRLNHVCYGNGEFMAIKYNSNQSFSSTDGITWSKHPMPSSQRWSAICYGNLKYIALASGSNIFAYCTDGSTWTQGTLPSSQTWNSVCYGNGKFVAVSSTNVMIYSTNGMSWTQGTLPSSQQWNSVCYGNGKFVAVGYVSDVFAYSKNGTSWTKVTVPITEYWTSVCYGNDKFIAIPSNDDDSDQYVYSTDGINWTQGTLPSSHSEFIICYGNNEFVAITNSNTYMYSTDGIKWSEHPMPSRQTWLDVCYGNDKYVVTTSSGVIVYNEKSIFSAYNFSGWNKTDNFNITSDTTITGTWNIINTYDWITATAPVNMLSGMCYGNDKFVYTGYEDFMYSTDGINWIKGNIPSTQIWTSVCYGNGKYVAVAKSTDVFAYSTDGINWTQGIMPSSQSWGSVTYGNGKYVAIVSGYTNVAAYSADGITWTASQLYSNAFWGNVYFANDRFIAVSTSSVNYCIYSTDGINWSQSTMPSTQIWTSVCYGNGKYVAVAKSTDVFAYSTDGTSWTQGTMPSSQSWAYAVYDNNNRFVAISGGSGTKSDVAAYSIDGINWINSGMPISTSWKTVCYGNGKFVAINGGKTFAYNYFGLPEDVVVID